MAIGAYYRFDGNSNDASGNANNGTDTSVTYNSGNGRFVQGAGFNGSSSYVQYGDTASLSPANLTLSFWIKNNATGTCFVIDKETSSGYGYKGWCFILLNRQIIFEIYANSTNKDVYATTLSDGVWYYVTCTYDGSYMRVYTNGALSATPVSATGNLDYSNTIALVIGRRATNGAYFFNGCLDEVIIDSVAWSAGQQKNKYAYYKGFF